MSSNIGLVVNPKTGFVGIGTAMPTSQFHVHGPTFLTSVHMGEMAGPILPSESNAFSVGSSNNRFLDAYFSRAVDISGVAISPDATGSGIKVTSAATGALVDVEANFVQASNIRSIGGVQAAYVLGSNIRSVGDVQAENLIADYVLGSNIRSVGDVQANYILGSNIRSVGDVQANFVLGSNIRSVGDVQAQNITASGLLTASNIRVLGDYVILDTITSNTEQMVITNDGTGPALKVTQTGANSIAEFYDDGNALAFKVANDGLIGIGTATPQQKLHVQGNILASGTVTGSSFSGSGASLTTLNADNVSSGTLAVARGGTGIASYAVGDLIYASGTTAITKLADVATGNSLISGGINAAPLWGKIGLTTHVTGTLGVANGGTGAATLTANKLLVGNGTTAVLQPTNLHWDNGNSRLGIGIASPSESLTVAGNLFLDSPGAVLFVGNNANSTIGGTIYFGGTYGDNNYDHAVIESRVYETSTEKSELLMFKGNDGAGVPGPDRIRLRASDIVFDTYSGATTDRVAESIRMVVKESGNVGIGTTNPLQKLHVEGNVYSIGGIVDTVIYTNNLTAHKVTTSSTAAPTGFTVTITPKRVSSKILITFSSQMTYIANASNGGRILLYKNGTNISNFYGTYFQAGPTGYCYLPTFFIHEDIPASTSPQKYEIYILSDGGYNFGFHLNSKITLMAQEIGA